MRPAEEVFRKVKSQPSRGFPGNDSDGQIPVPSRIYSRKEARYED